MIQEAPGTAEAPDGVVVGVDGSSSARHALAWAADEARARRAGLLVIGVAPAPPDRVPGWCPEDADVRSAWQAVVDDAVALAATRHPSVPVRGEVRWGAPADELVTAGASGALLVVGARGAGGFVGLLVGSVADRCLHRARGPVAVVRPPADGPVRGGTDGRVVVGIDGSEDTRSALRWALDEARIGHGSVEAVIAWQYPPTHALVATSALRFADAAQAVALRAREDAARWAPGVPFVVTVVDEAVVPALLDRSREAGLLVVGPHRQGGYRDLLLGSVAHQCAHHALCPVVVVQGPDPATTASGGRTGSEQAPVGTAAT